MAARRKPKPAAKASKGKERVEPHFGGKRAPARKPRKTARRSASASPIRRVLLRGLFTTLALIALVIVGSFLYFVARLPDPILLTLDDRPPNLTILASDGTVLAERGLRRGYVRLDRLPPYLPQAVIATEDRRFYNHLGVDPVGLVRAGLRNLIAGSVVQGGSTITQQLAKNLFLSPDRTMARKLEEAMYAIWLERRFTKDEILELYLNRVYFGGGTYGVEAAARRYFGRSARSVTLTQAALLAGLLKAPSRYAPTNSVTDTVVYTPPMAATSNCVSREDSPVLTPVGTVASGLKRLKAFPGSQILVTAITGLNEGPSSNGYTVTWRAAPTTDTGPWPAIAHACGTTSAATSFADPAVRIEQFVQQFGANGFVDSYCQTTYAGTLGLIATKLAAMLTP